jgi:hypothetical protein
VLFARSGSARFCVGPPAIVVRHRFHHLKHQINLTRLVILPGTCLYFYFLFVERACGFARSASIKYHRAKRK